ncbi:MAG: hypothetical protein LBC74_08690, partial [Planctomycetaceae bacterium]|nr:hypothetical protein [Planctomycetaceae bacterium]
MKFKIILFVLLFNLFVSFCFSQDTKNDIKDFDEFQKTMSLAHEIWQIIRPQSSSEQLLNQKLIAKVNELRTRPKINNDVTVSMIIARFDSLSSFSASDVINKFQDSLSVSNVIDWVDIVKLLVKDRQLLDTINKNEVNLLPLKAVCNTFPKKSSDNLYLNILQQWVRYPFPTDSPYRLFFCEYSTTDNLPLAFEKIGLYDMAWRIQMEDEKQYHHQHYSHDFEYCSYYLAAANNAYRSGNKKLGWSFLTNAAVLEDKRSFKQAMKLAKIWIDVEAGKIKLPEQKILTGEERKKTFLLIARSYQARNIHPRAWMFVNEHKNEFDNPSMLIKEIQDDWLEVLRSVIVPAFYEKVVWFGVELYPTKNDPLSINVPWPFPEGSIDKLKAKIQEVADKIKEEEKDGL